jgi:hypothetical protein
MNPADGLLSQARLILNLRDSSLAGVRERAAALVARQALEESVAAALSRRAPGTEHASATAQLLCLPTYAPNEPASEARYLWSVLSRVCHHHPYELAPTSAELTEWLLAVTRVVEQLAPPPADRVKALTPR